MWVLMTTRGETVGRRVRVVLVDDQAIVRKALDLLFRMEADLVVCGEAEGEPEALERIADLKPDLAVVDLGLVEGSGLSLIKRARRRCPQLKILVFSMYDQPHFVERAFEAGANGYVTKAQGTEELLKAVHVVMGGGRYLSKELAEPTKRVGPGGMVGRSRRHV